MKCSSTKLTIRLLLVGSTISSILLVSFHYKFSILKQRYDEQQLHQYGPPNYIHSPQNKILKSWDKTSILFISDQRNGVDYEEASDTNGVFSRKGKELTESDQSCFANFNSQFWLESERFGNQDSEHSRIIDDDYIMSSILNIKYLFSDLEINSQQILEHTICARNSRFLKMKFSSFRGDLFKHLNFHGDQELFKTTNITKNQAIHQLSFRLIYLCVHVHQHMYAMEEAKHRLKHPLECKREMSLRKIGKFDFECRDAKFLVVPMKHSGLGGQMRLITAPALMAGIASDRVVLFINNSPVGPDFLREPWDLSDLSLCPRGDKQCFFLPDSPCVITHNELQNATILGKSDRRALFKTGHLPDHMEGDRVVVMNMKDRPQRIPLIFRNRIVDIATQLLIKPLARENPSDPRLPLISAAANHILQKIESINNSFYYHGRNFQAHHAMVFFSMRPKVEFAERIDHIVESTLGENHQTDLALGLPIRASDKCVDESECPSFETYMLLMQDVWDTNKKSLKDSLRKYVLNSTKAENSTLYTNIILTSESSEILRAQKLFQVKNSSYEKNVSFPYKFITNRFDVLQNTGNPSKMGSSEHSKEEIMISALTSLKMQLYAKYSIGNCCSNHHLLLFDLLKGGCGAGDVDHVANCMQDHKDERFRVCCGWSKAEECLDKRSNRTAL